MRSMFTKLLGPFLHSFCNSVAEVDTAPALPSSHGDTSVIDAIRSGPGKSSDIKAGMGLCDLLPRT